ncbi:MAG TPA: maltotransferase domain-containing protein, partial [Acidimicrobiales bacterium]
MTGRLVIEDVRPRTPNAGHFAKAVVGESVPVRAVVFKEGHDLLTGRVLLVAKGRKKPVSTGVLEPVGSDEWVSHVMPAQIGPHRIIVEAWTDRHATWAHKVQAKLDAGQPIDVEIAEGLLLLEGAAAFPPVAAALPTLRDIGLADPDRVRAALSPEVGAALWGPEGAVDVTDSTGQPLWVDRERALFGAWYELFPRSFGGLKGAAARVPDLAAMGFDVLYLPPIHPIGHTARKGPDNTLRAGDDDPGSPWAIGSSVGGHTAVNPELGTIEDFSQLVAEVNELGMEVALDYALQCSPDHPWVHEHPEWFHHRPDGSIACAENPPKVYQDI